MGVIKYARYRKSPAVFVTIIVKLRRRRNLKNVYKNPLLDSYREDSGHSVLFKTNYSF